MDSPCVIAHQGKSASLCPLSLLHKSRRKSVNFHCHARVQPDMHDFAAVQENLIVGLSAVALEVNHPVRVLVKVSFLNGQVIQLRGLPGSEECPRIIVLGIRTAVEVQSDACTRGIIFLLTHFHQQAAAALL